MAAAVSRADGLGMVGIGSAGSALQLDDQLEHLCELARRVCHRPSGVGDASEPQLLTAAIAAKPVLLSVSFGEDFSWVRRAQDRVSLRPQGGDILSAALAVRPDATS